MANLKLEFEASDNFTGKLTGIAVNTYNYNKYGLQLYDDLSYNLNFQIFDIENLEKRASTYSKTIKLPGTAVNNAIFSHLYDIDISIPTNIYLPDLTDKTFFGKRILCELLYDSIPVKEGFFELKKVYYNEGRRQIEYEGEFYSNSKTFSENIGDKLLTGNENINDDLDFSMYDHPLSIENFIASHTGTSYYTSTGYYYPIIDYINLQEYNSIHIEELRPSLYVKEIIDKIFEKAGYSYTSTFFNSDFFKSLIIPWTGEVKIGDDELEKRNMKIGLADITGDNTDYTGDGSVIWGNASWGYLYRDFYSDPNAEFTTRRLIPFDDDSGDYYNSAFDDFDTTTHKWKVRFKGKYRISWTSTQNIYGIKWENGTGQAGPCYQEGDKFIEVYFQIWKQSIASDPQLVKELKSLKYLAAVAGDTWIPNWTEGIDYSGVFDGGDDVWFEIGIRNKNNWLGGSPRLWLDVKSSFSQFTLTTEPAYQLYEFETVEMRKALPDNTKQIDFFKDIINMFNLVVDEDPILQNTLYIETRDDYYYSGSTLDWTDKEDISQPEEIERIPLLINNDFKLSYQKDTDDLNKQYEDDNRGLIYGNKTIKNPYRSTGSYEVKVNFSPTPLTRFGATNWGVSHIAATNDNGEAKEQAFNTRILYRQNINGTNPGPNINYLYPVWVSYSGNTGYVKSFGWWPFGGADYPYQPYAGHLDNPYNPTLDLNFGICNNYYYTLLSSGMTSNNIYENYWKNYVAELMDINSKKVTKYLKLEVDDIYNLTFDSKIWIDGVLYILEKIIDWNPGQITKVELLKLSKYDLDTSPPSGWQLNVKQKLRDVRKKKPTLIELRQGYVEDVSDYFGGTTGLTSGGTIDAWTGRTNTEVVDRDNQYSDSAVGVIIGDGNIVESNEPIFIRGSNNIIRTGTTNISIFADNVEVVEGTKNLVVLASDETLTGKTKISTSNHIYIPTGYTIENVYTKPESQETFASIDGVFKYYSKTTQTYISSGEYIIGDKYNGTGRTITLSGDYVTLAGKYYYIFDELGNANTNNITVDCEASKTINGAATALITTNYGYLIIYSNGSNWFQIGSR